MYSKFNERYIVSGNSTYNKYKDKIKEAAMGTLGIYTYKNGSVEYDIVELKDK